MEEADPGSPGDRRKLSGREKKNPPFDIRNGEKKNLDASVEPKLDV